MILVGAVNGFIWSALIFLKKQKKDTNTWLGFFVFVFALGSIKIILQEKIPGFNRLIPVPLLYQFVFGPLLYLYVKNSLITAQGFSRHQLWHFLPSLLFDVLPALLLFSFPLSVQRDPFEKLSFLLDILAFIFFSRYWYLSLTLIRHYQKQLNGVNGSEAVRWTNKIIVASSLVVLSWLVYILWVIILKGRLLFGMMPYYPIYLILCFCIYGIGIAGYYRPEIGLLELPPAVKRKLMPTDELEQKKAAMMNEMMRLNYYRDENITLQSLAGLLCVPVNELSYIINTGLQMNFNDFINQLRVDDFKARLADPANSKYTMLGLAYDAGFSSKASFYRAFRKITGQTPSEYSKALQRPQKEN